MTFNRILHPEVAYELRRRTRRFDYALAASALALGVFGILMIYNATNTGYAPWFANLHRNQVFYVASGFFLLVAAAMVDYRFISKFYIVIYIVCILLLVAVLLLGFDEETGTARWFTVPIPGTDGISLQPSELAKIFILISLAKFLEVYNDRFNKIWWLFVVFVAIVVPVVLIVRQPSLSAGMVVAFTSFVILFTGGLYYRTLIITAVLIAPVAILVYLDLQRAAPVLVPSLFNYNYQWDRIETFLNPEAMDPDKYRQVQQSLFSIGSGGLYGKGFGNNGYVINGHNDFIFSVVAEQFGFAGCALLLGIMAFIIIKCIFVALRSDELQGRMIAAGAAGMLLFETFVNVGIVTEMLPNTGMTFPFLSYGGTSMWVHMAMIGLVINVSIPREKSMFSEPAL